MSTLLMQRVMSPLGASTSARQQTQSQHKTFGMPVSRQLTTRCSAYNTHDCRGPYRPQANFFGPANWASGAAAAAQLADMAQKFAASQAGGVKNFNTAVNNMSRFLPLDLEEQSDRYLLIADIPGLQKSDLKITVSQKDRTMKIAGERKRSTESVSEAKQAESKKYRKQYERSMGQFERQLAGIPKDADLSSVSARVDKGVLTIAIAKLAVQDNDDILNINVE